MAADNTVPSDNDYLTVVNVVQQVRNRSTDGAAREVAIHVALAVKAERERVLAEVENLILSFTAGLLPEKLTARERLVLGRIAKLSAEGGAK